MRTAPKDFHIAQKVIHWLMALIIMLDLFVAQKFGDVMELADRMESRIDHSQLGLIVTTLFIIRIALRVRFGAPALPPAMPDWQKTAAHIGHWGLYGLIACLVTTGLLTASNADTAIEPFGAFVLSDGMGSEAAFLQIRTIHELVTEALIALIALHIVAALYHGLVKRDGVTGRMMRFWKRDA